MKNIRDISVVQIRIFDFDVLPFLKFNTYTFLEDFITKFRFMGELPKLGSDKLQLSKGELKTEEKIIPIINLEIEPTKISFRVNGSSSDANIFYQAIAEIIISCQGDKLSNSIEPLVCVEQTTCIVELDLDIKSCLSDSILQFAGNNLIHATSNDNAASFLKGFKLSFEIGYNINDSMLKDKGVTFLPKYFTVEPRIGTSLKEKKYFTSSPTDSDTHIRLIKELEARLKERSRKPPKVIAKVL